MQHFTPHSCMIQLNTVQVTNVILRLHPQLGRLWHQTAYHMQKDHPILLKGATAVKMNSTRKFNLVFVHHS